MKTLKQLREDNRFLNEKATSLQDVPNIILLKRKSIRTFPDGLTVGLYYSEKLKRYVSIPFDPNSIVDAGSPE